MQRPTNTEQRHSRNPARNHLPVVARYARPVSYSTPLHSGGIPFPSFSEVGPLVFTSSHPLEAGAPLPRPTQFENCKFFLGGGISPPHKKDV